MVSFSILSEFGRDSGQSLDAVRVGSNLDQRPPTTSSEGDDARRWLKEGTPPLYSLLELELGVGDLHRVLGDGLAVLAAGVAPADVLVGRLVHVPMCVRRSRGGRAASTRLVSISQ